MGLFKDLATKYVYAPLADYLKQDALTKTAENNGGHNAEGLIRDPAYFRNPQYGRFRSAPGSSITFDVLRRYSVQYDVARACINRRKRQLNRLSWDIVSAETADTKNYDKVTLDLKTRMKTIGGYKVRFREFMDLIVEDLLAIDGVALEKVPNAKGQTVYLKPIDSTTIKLKVTETGDTPEPPEIAFVQMIRGQQEAEWTADEFMYEMMNPRTNTPYGLSPLESLVLGVSAAVKSEVFNLGLLTEGNIPEGLFAVPESWTPAQIKEFQMTWDAAIAGNEIELNKLRFVPPGTYTPTKKPEDMRYKEMQEWLMKKTCMMFEIQPQELGFTDTVNKATGEVQFDIGVKTGLAPLASFVEEILTDIVQTDWGYPQLRFAFTNLESTDEKAKADLNAVLINSGQRTIDELRTDDGLEPLGGGADKAFVIGTPTFIDQDSIDNKAKATEALSQIAAASQNNSNGAVDNSGNNADSNQEPPVDNSQKAIMMLHEFRTFRKYAITRVKDGKSIRAFHSDIIPEVVLKEINDRLEKPIGIEEVRSMFNDFMKDYQLDFLADLAGIKKEIDNVL